MPNLTDVAGVPIDIGDTVVYAVYTRHGGLQMGKVIDFVPFDNTRTIENPAFDPNRPQTYYHNGDNPRWISEEFIDYKIKVKHDDHHYTDHDGNPAVQKGKTNTLDNPKRFAVLKKA